MNRDDLNNAIKETERFLARGTTRVDQVADSFDELHIRTHEPLPEPEPDWLDARAVLADCDCNAGERTVYVNYSEIAWTCTDCDNPINPEDMKKVTPLYPKEDKTNEHDSRV